MKQLLKQVLKLWEVEISTRRINFSQSEACIVESAAFQNRFISKEIIVLKFAAECSVMLFANRGYESSSMNHSGIETVVKLPSVIFNVTAFLLSEVNAVQVVVSVHVWTTNTSYGGY